MQKNVILFFALEEVSGKKVHRRPEAEKVLENTPYSDPVTLQWIGLNR